jgi:hypothetical protein
MCDTSSRCERDDAVLETLLRLFRASDAREAERGIPITTIFHRLGWQHDRRDIPGILERLEHEGLITWVAVLGGCFRLWPTPMAVKGWSVHEA